MKAFFGTALLVIGFSAVLPRASAAEPLSSLPLPEMVVVRTSQPSVIDGQMAAGEWDRATAATAFLTAFKNELSPGAHFGVRRLVAAFFFRGEKRT